MTPLPGSLRKQPGIHEILAPYESAIFPPAFLPGNQCGKSQGQS